MNNKSGYQKHTGQGSIGHIESFFSGVAKIKGCDDVVLHEVLVDENSTPVALVVGFNEEYVEALFFNHAYDAAQPVFRSNRRFIVPIADDIVGRVISGMGNPRDGFGELTGEEKHVFQKAPAIIDREPVTSPLSTGIKIVDTALPLGKGQRQLIIGDRKLGKSTLALDAILNQKHSDPTVYCIYVLTGHKKQKLHEVISLLDKHNAFLYTTVVAATAEDSFAEQYLAPFLGCAIGEFMRDHGQHALIVYDDLSAHARTYRSISLLLGRAPGREAYPGDIFSLHAELLERAGNMSKKKGGGSLSALPIIETQEGDITSFVPTNLISITDGQIYLERGLFQKGFLPAVNVGLSVSRVGSHAQPKALVEVVGGIRLALAQHKELQKLTQLETVVSEQARNKIHRGELTLELLKQDKHRHVLWPEQVVLFYAVEHGYFDDMEKEGWPKFERVLLELMRNRYHSVIDKVKSSNTLDDTVKDEIKEIVEDAKQEFLMS
jgi:F-type H+-transporting ATPase subunit alpha